MGLEGFGCREPACLRRCKLPQPGCGEGQLHFSDQLSRVALFVGKQDHCLLDLLWRTRAGELPMQVPLVISNHPDLRSIAEDFGARFELVPVTAEGKQQLSSGSLSSWQRKGLIWPCWPSTCRCSVAISCGALAR